MKPCDEQPIIEGRAFKMPCIRFRTVAVPIIDVKDDETIRLLTYEMWLESLPDEERKRRGLI